MFLRLACVCLWLWLLLIGLTYSTIVADSIIANTTYTILKRENITKPGCSSKCGNVTVPFPFGIGPSCAFEPSYAINCDTTCKPPKPFINNLQVYDISDNEVRVSTIMAKKCYDSNGEMTEDITAGTDLSGSPYTFSELNMFTVIGCDDLGFLIGSKGRNFLTGCLSICSYESDVLKGECSGVGCCQTSIPQGSKHYNTSLSGLSNHSYVNSFDSCGYAFVAEKGSFNFSGVSDFIDLNLSTRPTVKVLDWVLGSVNCSEAQNLLPCKNNSHCVDKSSRSGFEMGGYRCECNPGYEGNPYLTSGCQDIKECHDNSKTHGCVYQHKCHNYPGNYSCSCPIGFTGDGKKEGTGCNKKFSLIQLSLGLSSGLLFLLVGITWLYLWHEKRKLISTRQKFFQQNGGLFLNQQLASNKEGVQTTKIFTAQELEKATNKYADEMILGQGGNGTVYKGILPDQTIVAIKKSKISDKNQIKQFINEVIILMQINHRNVVKLLGCCLEVEVPLLVYEYVSNGTLWQHIHNCTMSWENRLRIAAEAASSLAYLHSAASKPIIHRDVKSANILLDECCTAKMADFGASILVSLDQVHVITAVQGTFGYLDPEYANTCQLTEKSDVYSFGVVLAELLTGQKPIIQRGLERISLVDNFINSMKENLLFEILEPRIIREGGLEQLQTYAELVRRCLQLNGEDRPTMKDVEIELVSLRKELQSTNTEIHGNQEINVGGEMNEMNEASDLPLVVNASHFDQSAQYNTNHEIEFFTSAGPR